MEVVRASHPKRTISSRRRLPELGLLLGEFKKEKIRFQIAGMVAAVLQGVPAGTIDTDLWIDLPERSYPRLLGIAQRLGGSVLAQTVVALKDDTLVKFLFQLDGLQSFSMEYPKARRLHFAGQVVPVLPLRSIFRSKKAAGRPKDVAFLPLLAQAIRRQKR